MLDESPRPGIPGLAAGSTLLHGRSAVGHIHALALLAVGARLCGRGLFDDVALGVHVGGRLAVTIRLGRGQM